MIQIRAQITKTLKKFGRNFLNQLYNTHTPPVNMQGMIPALGSHNLAYTRLVATVFFSYPV